MNTAPAIEYLNKLRGCLVQDEHAGERKRAEKDSDYFAEKFTRWPRRPFHQTWVRELESADAALLLAPREHAKTMQITIIQVAHRILADRDLRVLIVSDTDAMSTRMGRAIKGLLTSAAVREVWGDVRGDKWSDKEFSLAGSTLGEKESAVTCLSVGGAVTSGHYDLIVLDDVVDFENSRTQAQRDKLWDWFRFTLMPVAARGALWVIGTRYHFDDLYGRLQDVTCWPRGIKLILGRAIQLDGTALWPEQYSLKKLKELQANLGAVIFGAQYQNDVEAMKGSVFKAEWFKRYTRLPDDLRAYQGTDLAIGDKNFNDYFAEVTLGLSKDGNIYVMGEYRDRLSFDQQYSTVQKQYHFYNKPTRPVMRIGIESNQYQAALARKLIQKTRLPVRAIHRHKDKMTMALRMQPLFENGKVFFPVEGTENLENELLCFGPGGNNHDDLVDGMITALEAAGKGGFRSARKTAMPAAMR